MHNGINTCQLAQKFLIFLPTALSLVEITGELFGILDGHIFVQSRTKADVPTYDIA